MMILPEVNGDNGNGFSNDSCSNNSNSNGNHGNDNGNSYLIKIVMLLAIMIITTS